MTTLTPEQRDAARGLLTTRCDCGEAWTARQRHAPDCRWQFIHDFLDDDEIATVLALLSPDTGETPEEGL